jgi:Bacterial regulatory proteins, luxR family
VAQGQTNAEVGRAIFLSTRTVEFHLSRAYRKPEFQVKSRHGRSTLPAMNSPLAIGPRHTADGRARPAERTVSAERGGVLADGTVRRPGADALSLNDVPGMLAARLVTPTAATALGGSNDE